MTEPDARTRLLDAAERAFADRGLAGARVAAIAADAGVNKAMLYYYFGSKDELFQAVIARVFEQIAAMVATVGQGAHSPGSEAAIRTFLAGYRRIVLERPAFVRLMARALLDQPQVVLDAIGPRLAGILPVVGALVAAGQARGELNPALDPRLVPPSAVAPLLFFGLAQPLLETLHDGPELADRWVAHTTELTLRGLLARGAE